jgi:hypothetical protein
VDFGGCFFSQARPLQAACELVLRGQSDTAGAHNFLDIPRNCQCALTGPLFGNSHSLSYLANVKNNRLPAPFSGPEIAHVMFRE